MAMHWTSATCAWFISFFLNLTSHIPFLASSCNNQIPSHTTSSASHGSTSTTSQPVADDSISVIDVVQLPTEDEAIRTLDALGTRSTMTARSSQARTFNLSRPVPVHPIVVLFQDRKLGKAVLGFALPIITGLLLNQNQGLTHQQAIAFTIALTIGFTTTWNGMLLQGIYPRVATTLECFGVGTVLVSFFGMVSYFLPPSIAWLCWLCCGLSCLPFLLCLVLPTAVGEASSTKRLDQGIV